MPVPPSPPRSRLAEHVRACRIGEQVIFLDLLRSKYIGMGGPRLSALSPATFERTALGSAPSPLADQALPIEWIRHLRDQNQLSEAPDDGPLPVRPTLPEALDAMDFDDGDLARNASCRDLARLWQATLVTVAWVRWRSLADIADRVVALRARHAHRGCGGGPEAMRHAVASYLHWRPFVLTTHDRCLRDSLALVRFMAVQGLFPHWVIGVRVHPFAAHSWVQCGSVVLNDLPERVRRYRPILVV